MFLLIINQWNTKRGVEKVGLAETCTLAAIGCFGNNS